MPPSSAAVVVNNCQFMEPSQRHGATVQESRFYDQCRDVAAYVLMREFPSLKDKCSCNSSLKKHGEKMLKLTQNMRSKHELFFQGMSQRLDLNEETIGRIFTEIAEEIFDREWNFGRVVSLYAFLVTMVKYCMDHDMTEKIDLLIHLTARTAARRERQFVASKGWDGFLLHFTDSNDRLWRGILVTTISLGALATLLYARP